MHISVKAGGSHTIHAAAAYCPRAVASTLLEAGAAASLCLCTELCLEPFPLKSSHTTFALSQARARELKAVSRVGMLKSELLGPTPTFVDFHHCFP